MNFARRGSLLLIFAFFLALSFPSQIESQTEEPVPLPSIQNFHQWGAVTLFNGLPSDNVRAIAQTDDGILWFGTDNGLAKFDGRRVTSVPLPEAQKIFALQVTSEHQFWIGTDVGAFVFDGKNFQVVEETKNVLVTAILEADGKIRLATAQGFILTLTKTENNSTFSVKKQPSENLREGNDSPLKITSLAQLNGQLIAGTRGRSFIAVEDERAFEFFSRPRPFFVNALATDQQTGAVWLGADSEDKGSGLFLMLDAGRPERIGAGIGNVTTLMPDNRGGVWAGTETNGLFHFAGEKETAHYTFENTAGGLRSNSINALFIDREGVLWVGTTRGISRLDASSPSNVTVSDKGNGNFVRTIFRTRSGQTLAGTNRGLFVSTKSGWLESQNFSGKTIYAIAENLKGETLLATPNGIFNGNDSTAPKISGDARGIANFRGATYAAIFGRGLINVDTGAVISIIGSPTALFAGKDKLFVGTATGEVLVFDDKQFERQSSFESMKGAAIWKIYESENGDQWLAGERGLFLFRNGNLQNLLASQDVRDVIGSGQEIWAATVRNGVYHLREDENFGWLVSNLNVEQGLPSGQVFALLADGKNLIVGTNRGTSFYQPSDIAPQIIPTRVLSQRLHAAEEIPGPINLEYPQNSLLVEVSGLSSRTFPEQFQYSFLLKNAEGETIDKKLSTDAQFAPANLAASEYTIEARAINKDLRVSEPLIIKFSVARAPFPRTAFALGILLAVAGAGLIWAIIEHRRIRDKNRQLAAARFDLANEAERERRRIARDLHDQTLADLRELMLESDKMSTSDNNDFRREIESVSTEIRRICEDLSPSVLENVGLSPAIEFLLSRSHAAGEYIFHAGENVDETANFSPNLQMQIYRIAQEILTNIKHHAEAKKIEIEINISPENEYVLQIKNDGKFFEPAKIDKSKLRGRGIGNIKSRAALIRAEIDWRKSDSGETVFELKKKL